ncbi:MAG: hypothetical protein E4H37_01275 [Gemmatimonadales bacterium]|nr:MAG: hypothetical protein E4H37_01275 [Gemmatimonadales bacterium]
MRTWHARSLLPLGVVVAFAVGCGDSNGSGPNPPPEQRPPAALNILKLAQASPPVFNPVETFWAKKGEQAEARIYFQDAVGGQGEEYLRLRIDDISLETLPNGTPIAIGDSVLITIRSVDPTQILFELEPTGLKFNPLKPAELDIKYQEADDDFNEDGVVDLEDEAIEDILAIWRQENPGDDFVKIGSFLIESLEEIEAELTGFSRYAIAY